MSFTILIETCRTLSAPSHGRLTTSKDGEFAFFSCKRGYTMKGSDVLQCVNGKWNKSPPSCEAISKFCRRRCNF